MESSAPAARLAPAVLDPRRWWALALLCGAFFMVLLDGTITIVALPSIGATHDHRQAPRPWTDAGRTFQYRQAPPSGANRHPGTAGEPGTLGVTAASM